jgi:hypothetical protein
MSQPPLLRFGRAEDALPQDVVIGVEHDMEHPESGVAQPGNYLIQVAKFSAPESASTLTGPTFTA